jgi:hypothetical protein
MPVATPVSAPCKPGRYHAGEVQKENRDARETTPFAIRSHSSTRRRSRLDRCLVGDRYDVLGLVVLEADEPGVAGLRGHALHLLGLASLLGLLLLGEVGLDALEEVLTRARVADVLDADVDALLHVAVADLLLQNDTDGRLGHVVDDTGLAVVDLVGHTLLDSTCACQLLPFLLRFEFPIPLATTSTMSPTLYCFMYVDRGIIPFWRKLRLKLFGISSCRHRRLLLHVVVVGGGGGCWTYA